jgi:DNA polymerase I-like protein with 3'-5' exonuclease and polymerase domains
MEGLVSGPFCKVTWVPLNLDSDKQVKEFLYTQGWQPTAWNYQKDRAGRKVKENGQYVKTSPKLTEDSYDSIEGDTGKLIARRNILVHRRRSVFNVTSRGELKGFLNLTRASDGKIEARGIPQGTNTGRYRHSILVNVPAANPKVVYGKEMRALFTVDDGYLMLGTDASALEARMEAHYCYDFEGGHEYAHDLVDGDIHAKNAVFFGTDRDGAKSPKYCLTYGGQPPTLADTVGCTLQSAQRMYDNFWLGNTALAGFREHVEREFRNNGTTINMPQRGGWIRQTTKNGWIAGLDGRKIWIRSPHACVNAKFQSGGSIVVKMATIFMNKWIRERRLDAKQIIHMHDEIQFQVHPKDVEALTDICKRAWVKAGEFFNMNVPIVGEVKVGHNWAETH